MIYSEFLFTIVDIVLKGGMSMPKVSIIVPIYNSEKYIERCIKSILAQTLEDIEIILVDDGSTDSSPELCDKYVEQDSRVKVIHKENAGMGAAYNSGINAACGEYIGFVESDDYINKFMYEDLYNLTLREKVDVVKSNWFIYLNNQVVKTSHLNNYNSYEIIESPNHSPILRIHASIWSAIYNREFLLKNNLRFLETPGASYQDSSFSLLVLFKLKNIILSPNAYYYYYLDNETSSVHSRGKQDALFNEFERADKFLQDNPDIKSWANTDKLIRQYWDYIWNLNRVSDELKPYVLKKFAQSFRKYNDLGELTQAFWAQVEQEKLQLILNMAE